MKKYRMRADLTQDELGDMIGITKGFVSQIENGKTDCAEWLAESIAKALRIDVRTLFSRQVERKARYMRRKVVR